MREAIIILRTVEGATAIGPMSTTVARGTVKGYRGGSPAPEGVITAEVWESGAGRTKRVRIKGAEVPEVAEPVAVEAPQPEVAEPVPVKRKPFGRR
jgi:hypothetical protein